MFYFDENSHGSVSSISVKDRTQNIRFPEGANIPCPQDTPVYRITTTFSLSRYRAHGERDGLTGDTNSCKNDKNYRKLSICVSFFLQVSFRIMLRLITVCYYQFFIHTFTDSSK